MRSMGTQYDILIAGGGMVGASLARALADVGLRIAVVEPVSAGAEVQPSYDDRVIALSWGSRLILQGIGCWDMIRDQAEPIRRIHISDRGRFGFTHLDHAKERVPALGYVVAAKAIGAGLLQGIGDREGLDWLSPANIRDFQVDDQAVRLDLDVGGAARAVTARLLVAADGAGSPIRQALGVPVREWQYGHTAVIANVTPAKAHGGVAYERFTASGPLAMLPMTEGRCSMVWTQREAGVSGILAMQDGEFLARLQEQFGYRLGRFLKVGERAAYPLRLLRVREMVRPRVAIIGNAAHTLHPVSGQGLNLGLRDVALLADLLGRCAAEGGDPGSGALLGAYAAERGPDQRRVALITDLLARVFVNPLQPVQAARNCGMLALDLVPGLKHEVARQFMGLRGRLPRLARGLPLG
jgi:2-octaprenyl-6-methoxyphenol hydroxylase